MTFPFRTVSLARRCSYPETDMTDFKPFVHFPFFPFVRVICIIPQRSFVSVFLFPWTRFEIISNSLRGIQIAYSVLLDFGDLFCVIHEIQI